MEQQFLQHDGCIESFTRCNGFLASRLEIWQFGVWKAVITRRKLLGRSHSELEARARRDGCEGTGFLGNPPLGPSRPRGLLLDSHHRMDFRQLARGDGQHHGPISTALQGLEGPGCLSRDHEKVHEERDV